MRKVNAAILLCKFDDVAAEPQPRGFYESFFCEAGQGTGGGYDYWRDISYGKVTFEGSTVFGWLTTGHSSQEIGGLTFPGDRVTLWQWGVEAAQGAGIDVSTFAVVVVVLNTGTDHGSAGGNRVVFAYSGTTWEPTFVVHEIGHSLGLDHSWSAAPDQVYGDRWDIMSAMNVWTFTGSYGTPTGPGLCAPYLDRLGALPAGRIWAPTAGVPTATVALAPLSDAGTPGSLALRIPAGFLAPSQSQTFYAECRARSGWDKGVPPAVLIHEVRPNGLSYLLAPQLTISGDSYTSPGGNLRVTLLSAPSAGGSTVVQVDTAIQAEPAECSQIRSRIESDEAEIAGLQDELQTAGPGQKPFIAAQIRRLRQDVQGLQQRAKAIGCNPLP
jgi:Metallo-peptidase family M12B Reprolysin-like